MTYSSSLSLARSQQRLVGRNQNAVSFRVREATMGPITSTVTLVIMACLLGLLYLTQVTKTNAYGYQINSLRQQQTALQNQHDDLVIASARLQSLDHVASSDTAKNLVSLAPSTTIAH